MEPPDPPPDPPQPDDDPVEPLEVRRRQEPPEGVSAEGPVVPPVIEDDELGDGFAELGEDHGALAPEESAMHWEPPK